MITKYNVVEKYNQMKHTFTEEYCATMKLMKHREKKQHYAHKYK